MQKITCIVAATLKICPLDLENIPKYVNIRGYHDVV